MRDMRRVDRLMHEEEALKILVEGQYGIFATVDDENQPYGTPLSYVVKENNIYFHCFTEGSKLDNIKNNNKVCFSVVGKTKVLPDKFGALYESVIVFGEANLISDEKEKVMVFREFLKKYCSEFISKGEKYIDSVGPKAIAVKITIKSYTGKHRV